MNDLFINKGVWSKFNEQELAEYIQQVFEYYKSTGFPYFKLTEKQIDREIDKMKRYDTKNIVIEDNVLKQYMLGLNLVNYFMPHMWAVNCNGFKSPLEAYNDDTVLRTAVIKRIKMGDNMSDAGMRKTLAWVNGTHRVSNFRPTIAKWIYDTYGGEGNILDFSSGYGGRLFGAICSDRVKSYTGTDPCKKTYEQLISLNKRVNTVNKEVNLYNLPFEELELVNDYYDLAFSSPPYYNTEEYDYEDTQSYQRYKTPEEWKNKFLKVLINKCYQSIKWDGYFIINIANVRNYPNLEEDTLTLAKEAGFKYIDMYKMSLSSLMGKGYKYEPVFIFKKEKGE